MGRTGNSKQSSAACRDNHCKAPLSHSVRIKPTGLICRPTENTHTHTRKHTQMPQNTCVTHGPLWLSFTFPSLHLLSISFHFGFHGLPLTSAHTRTNKTYVHTHTRTHTSTPSSPPFLLPSPPACTHSNGHLSTCCSVHAVPS